MDKGGAPFEGPEAASVIKLHQTLVKRFPTTQFLWWPSTTDREYSFSIGFDIYSTEEIIHAMTPICTGKTLVQLTIRNGILCFECD